MPADGQHEVVAQAIKAALENIDGSVRFHLGAVAHEVFAVDYYHRRYWADEFDLIHMVRPGRSRIKAETNCEFEWTREFFIIATKKSEDSGDSLPWQNVPSDGGPLPTTQQNRLLDDIEQALLEDRDLGGAAFDTQVTNVEYQFLVDGWVTVEAVVAVVYHVPKKVAP